MRSIFLISLIIAACGTDHAANTKVSPKQDATALGQVPPPSDEDPSQNKVGITPIITAVPTGTVIVGAVPVPATYTRYVASAPHGVECIDAFISNGYPAAAAIESATYRTAKTVFGNSIAVGDYNATAVPVLNIISIESKFSTVELRLYNPLGFYCLVRNGSFASKINIQRKCTAAMVSLDNNIDTFFGSNSATTTSFGVASDINELPCIP